MRLGDAKFRNYSGNFGWITHSQLRAGVPPCGRRGYTVSQSVRVCLSVCRKKWRRNITGTESFNLTSKSH